VASEYHVTRRILGYTSLTALATLLLALATGWLYSVVALPAAAWLLVTARQLHVRSGRGEPVEPLRLFQRCNTYLGAVFCALAVDSALALPTLLGY